MNERFSNITLSYFKEVVKRKPWLYTSEDKTRQIGGFWRKFASSSASLTYTTVLGAGHMVPEDKPAAALYLLEKFLNKQDLS